MLIQTHRCGQDLSKCNAVTADLNINSAEAGACDHYRANLAVKSECSHIPVESHIQFVSCPPYVIS